MAKNKVTMRDIAKQCNVSVATVSYVLNHSEKEKISHDTFLKVTETATKLHYVPSPFYAKHVGRKSNLVGIIINLKELNAQSKKMLYYDLAAEVAEQLKFLDFESVLISTQNLCAEISSVSKRNFDAIFMIDVDNEYVDQITRDYFVPIIFLNCDVDDALFCKVYPNYMSLILKAKQLLQSEDPFLIMEDICSQNLTAEIQKWFFPSDIFINTPHRDLHMFLESHLKKKGIVFGDLLAIEVARYMNENDFIVASSIDSSELLPPGVRKLYIRNKKIAETAAVTLKSMLNFEYNAEQENKILIPYEL